MTSRQFQVRRLAARAAVVLVFALVPALQAADDFALLLDGSGDYAAMGQAPGLGLTAFTLELRFMRTSTGATATSGTGGVVGIPLLCKGRGESDGNNRDANYFFCIRGTDNVLAADFEDSVTGGNHPVAGTTPIQTGVWYHAAATYDGTNWRLYLNGNLEADLPIGASPRADSIQHFGIGSALDSTGTPSGYFAGLVREARVWNYARSETEIQDNLNVDIPSAAGLVGRWGLDTGSGMSALDSSGSAYDGTIVSGLWSWQFTPGPGTALEFDGNGDYVTMGAAPALGATAFTLEGWFKRTGTGATGSSGSGGVVGIPLICKGRGEADGNNRDCNYFFCIRGTDNVLAADFEDTASGGNHPVAGSTIIQLGVWYHAAATYDGTTWRLYLNGQLERELAANATPRSDSIQHFSLATALTSTGVAEGYLAGILDEVRVWNYARTQQQIQDGLYLEIPSETGLLGRWGLNEGTGTVAGDSANANPGTIQNALWVPGVAFPAALMVRTLEATEVTSGSATLHGELVNLGGNSQADVLFRWGTDGGNLDQATAPQTLLATGAFSDAVSGLTEGQTYYFQAEATTGGNTAQGAMMSFLAVDNAGLDFDGSSHYVTMGPAPALGASAFTLETWFKRSGTGIAASSGSGGVSGVPLICKGRGEADGDNRDCNYFFAIRDTDGVLVADFEDTASGLNHPVVGTRPVQTDAWYHAAATYDGATWRLYLNGSLEAELAVNATPRFDSIQHFSLGSALTSTGVAEGYFAGVLDEVRVWNYARTQQEISDNINAEIASAPGLLGRWGLDEAMGTTAGDSSGNGNDGTILGAIWVAGAPFDYVPPVVVETLPATGVTATGALLNGELTDLGAETQVDVYFRWGIDEGNLDQATAPQALTAPGTFNASLGGLSEETVYYFQAVAEGTTQIAEGAVLSFLFTDNYGLSFNGSSSYVTMGPAPALGSATFTIETWFKRTGTGQTANSGTGGYLGIPLVCKGVGEAEGSNVDANYFFAIRGSNNVIAADFEDTVDGTNHPVFGVTPIQTGVWYHAAATYDGTTWRLYLDGKLESELAVGATPRFDSIQHFGLGAAFNSTGTPSGRFDGVLDEVRVWNHARTQAEIQATINSEVSSATGLLGRWGLNEGIGTTAGDSSGNANDGTITAGAWVPGAPFDVNLPPALPVLISPPDASAVEAPTTVLAVQVSDPEADVLEVRFYGRAQTVNTGDPFTIVVIPDTQFYSQTYPTLFNAQTQWIVDNQSALNIQYVAHVGDVVNVAADLAQWTNANAAMSILDTAPDLPYGICVGNHDQDPEGNPDVTANYNVYFPYTRYEGVAPWYGGHYGTDNDNHYILFSAGGMDFIAIHMEYDSSPEAAVLAWAGGLLQTYSQRRAIVIVHNLIGAGNPGNWSAQGAAVYDALKGYPNLFLMLCGHVLGEGQRRDVFNGITIDTLMADYQGRTNGGNGWLRTMEFVPADNAIHVRTYSPTLDQYETDADSEFTLNYDMGSAGFVELGVVNGVTSGNEASIDWTGLVPGLTYEWYATVFDGDSTVPGPIWSFNATARPGDCDSDGDVDLDDYLGLAACLQGPGVSLSDGCECFDLNGDLDVDLEDFARFLKTFTGGL